jgi:hypothetical protein
MEVPINVLQVDEVNWSCPREEAVGLIESVEPVVVGAYSEEESGLINMHSTG